MVNIMYAVTAGLWVQKLSGHNTFPVCLPWYSTTCCLFFCYAVLCQSESTKQYKGSLTICVYMMLWTA